jgi:NADH:ubiquinone oxidoreductase subunit F (NADH-binding)/NAD-dependent dihydropyrimidine dehydrogenase PreA subunit
MIMNFADIKTRADNVWKQFSTGAVPRVLVGAGTCGRAAGALEIIRIFKERLSKAKIEADIFEVGCLGMCYAEVLVEIALPGGPRVLYRNITPKNAAGFILDCLEKKIVPLELAMASIDGKPVDGVPRFEDIQSLKGQMPIVLRNCGWIDPLNIDHYIARGGYSALETVITKSQPDAIIDAMEKSGLRGRGGGGFPTGKKWKTCRSVPGERKFVLCNADEGDPGAYMDRSVLEGDPHSIIEGMIIGAYAIGAREGYVYVRGEYPLAVENITRAIRDARGYGLLGSDLFGTKFSFDIKVVKGGGAFVCGESTALMLSIEGKVGEPRTKHIHSVESGLYDMPSALNNVETWANVPLIAEKGPEWFRNIGTAGSKGTKVFSLVGKVVNTGLVEVPMGVTLRTIIFDIGGGIPHGKKFKAVQTGGPSGGCIPEDRLDLPVDFDELKKVGSIMGSGGMIVMDQDTCMVDVARYFLTFLVEESCGKCTPCREGTYQLLKIVDGIAQGRGKAGDIELLEELSETIVDSSLCGLGKSAPNPVISTIRYFRSEYEEHILNHHCPAGVCKALLAFSVVSDTCTKCGVCFKKCPSNAISWKKGEVAVVLPEKCTRCGICHEACKFDSIVKV